MAKEPTKVSRARGQFTCAVWRATKARPVKTGSRVATKKGGLVAWIQAASR